MSLVGCSVHTTRYYPTPTTTKRYYHCEYRQPSYREYSLVTPAQYNYITPSYSPYMKVHIYEN